MSAERWQECPVCKGRGDVPWDFYAKMAPTSAVDPRTRCRTCWGATVLDTLVDRDDCPTCRRLIEATMAEMERDADGDFANHPGRIATWEDDDHE